MSVGVDCTKVSQS